jgi:hypothetical protein
MAAEELQGVREKIKRSEENLAAFYIELVNWWNSEPHGTFFGTDPETGKWKLSIIELRSFPPRIRLGVIAGDCVHNTRSALDHLAYEVAKHDLGHEFNRAFFPIYRDGAEYRRDMQTRYESGRKRRGRLAWLNRLDPENRARICRAQPYQGGQDADSHPLAILNALSNIDKHRTINVVIPDVAEWPPLDYPGPYRASPKEQAQIGGEDVEAGTPPEMYVSQLLPVVMKFRSPREPTTDGRPVMETLATIIASVERLTDEFEAATFPAP